MAKLRIKLNRRGVRDLMKSQEIMDECVRLAQQKANQAGSGYVADSGYVGKNRVNAMVYPSSAAARQDNYHNNTLLKVFGGTLKTRKK